MKLKNVASFQKEFDFCQTLITLTMHIYYNALVMNLEIKIGISLCESDILFLKRNPHNFV